MKTRKIKTEWCGNRKWTKTGKSKKLNGHSGMNFVPCVITDYEMTCSKCGITIWAGAGLVMCTAIVPQHN